MNSVVLKGKLGAGFNDDRYTLPKDGNAGDILVKTETGSAWQKQEQGGSGRVFVTGTITEVDGGTYVATDETQEQIDEMYIGGKDVVLEVAIDGEDTPMRLSYNGELFYSIEARETSTTINKIGLIVAGGPIHNYGEQRTLWRTGDFSIGYPK